MYIEDRLFSERNPEEVFYSITMTEEEYDLYSDFCESFYSDHELKTGDKIGIWAQKHLNTKNGREAVAEAYGEGKYHKLGKHNAKVGAAVGGALGGGIGYITGGAKGALKGAAVGAGASAAGQYIGTRIGGGIRNMMAEHSRTVSDENSRIADRARVASGKMSKKEYIKKHNK